MRTVASVTSAGRDLPRAEFAFPEPLRDRLVEAILTGAKTSTTGLRLQHEREGEPLSEIGQRSLLVDSDDRGVAVLETTAVAVVPLATVDLAHVRAEGEGFETVAAWRSAHERFFCGPEMRAVLGDPVFTTDDTTLVVLERFRVVERLGPRVDR